MEITTSIHAEMPVGMIRHEINKLGLMFLLGKVRKANEERKEERNVNA